MKWYNIIIKMVVIVMTEGTYEQVINELDRLGIKYGMVDHPAAETTEQADKYIWRSWGCSDKDDVSEGKEEAFLPSNYGWSEANGF